MPTIVARAFVPYATSDPMRTITIDDGRYVIAPTGWGDFLTFPEGTTLRQVFETINRYQLW